MTLDEAIIHAEAVAWEEEKEAKRLRADGDRCSACAAEHRQLAKWLKELRERRGKDGDTE